MTSVNDAPTGQPDQLGDFEIIEPVNGNGTLYKAKQHLGEGITRPASVKVLDRLGAVNEQRALTVRREVELLADLSACPNIVTVYGCGLDERFGPWIAMEPTGRSLSRVITNQPADAGQLRTLLRDILQALAVVHGAESPIVHRDLKPTNIVCTRFGTWQIAHFGFAKHGDTDEPLDPSSVQYAAPEMLDPTRGPESPQADLYSLGVIAYELALGRTLFCKQFPSVYDPDAERSKRGDTLVNDQVITGPKWMYWHTSQSMAACDISELLEDFPKDLSDLIASMMTKPLNERLPSAEEGLRKLGESVAMMPLMDEIELDRPDPKRRQRLLTYAAAVLVPLLLIMGTATIINVANRPSITLLGDGFYSGTDPIIVSGLIDNFPDGGSAEVVIGGTKFPVHVGGGEFVAEVTLPRLGDAAGELVVYDANGSRAAERLIRLNRRPPTTVQVSVRTEPSVSGALVRIIRPGMGHPIEMRTDSEGLIRTDLAYGAFTLEIEHPRFKPLRAVGDTGIAPSTNRRATLEALSFRQLSAKREKLLKEMEDALNGDPALLVERLTAITKQLELLEPGQNEINYDSNASERRKRLAQIQALAIRAARGDKDALRQLKALRDELQDLQPPPDEVASSLAAGGSDSGGPPAGALSNRNTAQRLSLYDLKIAVERQVPTGALQVEQSIDRIRIRGPVFNQIEKVNLATRIAAALQRVDISEVSVDPWAVAKRLKARLIEQGAENVDVVPYLTSGEQILYILYKRTESFDAERIRSLAGEFVLDQDLIYPQPEASWVTPSVN